jgi:hypothetical protein
MFSIPAFFRFFQAAKVWNFKVCSDDFYHSLARIPKNYPVMEGLSIGCQYYRILQNFLWI